VAVEVDVQKMSKLMNMLRSIREVEFNEVVDVEDDVEVTEDVRVANKSVIS
jgi:hypothetical protein